jgi:5'-nucleotidase
MEKCFKIITAVFLSVLLSAPGIAGDLKRGKHHRKVDFRLVLLHNNDGESELLPSGEEGGVARFATVLRKARFTAWKLILKNRGKGGALFVSSGDNFLASPAYTASLENGIFYDAVALDLLRYNAICLGNHDFDFGPDLLADFISEGFRRPGKPPYLSANLDFSGEPSLQVLVENGIIAKSTVVRVRREKIGVIGATTENLPFISSPRDVVVNAVLEAVRAEVDKLTNKGVDKIILISHLQSVDEDKALASQLTDVDVMVAGGGDELLAKCTTVDNCQNELLPSDLRDEENNETGEEIPDGIPDELFGTYPLIAVDADGKEIPVVTTSGQYGYLGRVVVDFDKKGNVIGIDKKGSGPIRVVSRAFPDGVRENRWMKKIVVEPVEAFVADLEANIIATSEVDLDGIRNNVRSRETNEGNLIADALLWQATQLAAEFGTPEPDVALQNGGGIRNDSIIPDGEDGVSGGPITELDTFDMVPFPNFVAVFPAIPRSQFKEILENAVSRTQTDDIPGGTGRFAQIAGFNFTFTGGGTAQELNPDGTVVTPGTRIVDVELDDGTGIVSGGSVVPGPDIVVATIDFLARGGDEYPFRDEPFTVLGVSYQQALSNYIQDAAGLNGLISAADYPEGGEGRIAQVPTP